MGQNSSKSANQRSNLSGEHSVTAKFISAAYQKFEGVVFNLLIRAKREVEIFEEFKSLESEMDNEIAKAIHRKMSIFRALEEESFIAIQRFALNQIDLEERKPNTSFLSKEDFSHSSLAASKTHYLPSNIHSDYMFVVKSSDIPVFFSQFGAMWCDLLGLDEDGKRDGVESKDVVIMPSEYLLPDVSGCVGSVLSHDVIKDLVSDIVLDKESPHKVVSDLYEYLQKLMTNLRALVGLASVDTLINSFVEAEIDQEELQNQSDEERELLQQELASEMEGSVINMLSKEYVITKHDGSSVCLPKKIVSAINLRFSFNTKKFWNDLILGDSHQRIANGSIGIAGASFNGSHWEIKSRKWDLFIKSKIVPQVLMLLRKSISEIVENAKDELSYVVELFDQEEIIEMNNLLKDFEALNVELQNYFKKHCKSFTLTRSFVGLDRIASSEHKSSSQMKSFSNLPDFISAENKYDDVLVLGECLDEYSNSDINIAMSKLSDSTSSLHPSSADEFVDMIVESFDELFSSTIFVSDFISRGLSVLHEVEKVVLPFKNREYIQFSKDYDKFLKETHEFNKKGLAFEKSIASEPSLENVRELINIERCFAAAKVLSKFFTGQKVIADLKSRGPKCDIDLCLNNIAELLKFISIEAPTSEECSEQEKFRYVEHFIEALFKVRFELNYMKNKLKFRRSGALKDLSCWFSDEISKKLFYTDLDNRMLSLLDNRIAICSILSDYNKQDFGELIFDACCYAVNKIVVKKIFDILEPDNKPDNKSDKLGGQMLRIKFDALHDQMISTIFDSFFVAANVFGLNSARALILAMDPKKIIKSKVFDTMGRVFRYAGAPVIQAPLTSRTSVAANLRILFTKDPSMYRNKQDIDLASDEVVKEDEIIKKSDKGKIGGLLQKSKSMKSSREVLKTLKVRREGSDGDVSDDEIIGSNQCGSFNREGCDAMVSGFQSKTQNFVKTVLSQKNTTKYGLDYNDNTFLSINNRRKMDIEFANERLISCEQVDLSLSSFELSEASSLKAWSKFTTSEMEF